MAGSEKVADLNTPRFVHSPSAIARFPAPVREFYFTPADYAAACMRVHEKRLLHDKKR